jgi:hypothetical protein
MGTVKVYSPRQVGELMGLTHQEVIRRIHKGQIEAQKVGAWNWMIQQPAVEAAIASDWYKRRLTKLGQAAPVLS